MSSLQNTAEATRVCLTCISDTTLSGEVAESGEIAECNICRNTAETWSLTRLASRVDEVYRRLVQPGDVEPRYDVHDEHMYLHQAGDGPEEILQELLSCEPELVDALLPILRAGEAWSVVRDGCTPFYEAESAYTLSLPRSGEYAALWTQFCYTIRSEQRFFNRGLKDMLDTIIPTSLLGQDSPAVRTIGLPDTRPIEWLYRARLARDADAIYQILADPVGQFGPPPQRLRRAGRMNAAGIPVLYMAFEQETSVIEVRPRPGMSVVVAGFRPRTPIRLLDLSELGTEVIGSLFRPDLATAVDRREFLANFATELSLPVLEEHEHLDYLPTQCIAEYLQHAVERPFHGVIFRSALEPDGQNVVLFGSPSIGIDDGGFPVSPANVGLEWDGPDESDLFTVRTDQVADEQNRFGWDGVCNLEIQTDSLKVMKVTHIKAVTKEFIVEVRRPIGEPEFDVNF